MALMTRGRMSDGGVGKESEKENNIAEVIRDSEMSCGQASGEFDIN